MVAVLQSVSWRIHIEWSVAFVYRELMEQLAMSHVNVNVAVLLPG